MMVNVNMGFSRLKGLVVGVLGLLLYWLHPMLLDNLDLRIQDAIHAKRIIPAPDKKVTVITIDEKSIAQVGRWPWSREQQAKLITSIKQAQALVVGLDIVYSSPQSALADKALIKAISRKGSQVIGGYFFRSQQSLAPSKQSLSLFENSRIQAVFETKEIEGELDIPGNFPYIETNILPIQNAFTSLGFFNYIPDPDGLLRRIPLVLPFDNYYYPSLTLQSLSRFTNKPIVLETTLGDVAKLKLGQDLIPTDNQGKMVLSFYSDSQSIPLYSAVDVMQGKHNKDLKDKLVFIGVTELGIADVRPTPVHSSFPGVMAHAVAASNILQQHFSIKNKKTILFDVLAMLLLPMILFFLLSFTKKLFSALGIFAILSALFSLIYYWLLAYQGWLVSAVYPLLLLLITFISHQIWFNLVSQKETRFIKNAFSSYVSPVLVDTIVDNQENLALGGKEQELSILFSDIRDFTAMSERLTPTQLVSVLNIYMDVMTRIAMGQKGTLDKYIGDAMMVLYNAPIEVEKHAIHAALSAIEMTKALSQVNKEIMVLTGEQLEIGIGINTGEAVVGNMGSDIRFDYTAIGDNVNLAARLEAATKMYGVMILISEQTYQKIKDDFYCKEVDRLQVKGKEEAVTVYELMAVKTEINQHYQNEIMEYTDCMKSYYARDFDAAIKQLQGFLLVYEENGPAVNLLKRCENYLLQPPAENWKGVHVALNK